MKWSWSINTIASIGVFTHATYLLIIGWVGRVIGSKLVLWLEHWNAFSFLRSCLAVSYCLGLVAPSPPVTLASKFATSPIISTAGLPGWQVSPRKNALRYRSRYLILGG